MNVHREPAISQPTPPRPGESSNVPERDSAYYSGSSSGDASKHTSVVSNAPSTYTGSPTRYHSETHTPPPISILNQPLVSPATSGPMSVTSMISPSTPSSVHMDRSMLDKLNRTTVDPMSQRSSYVSSNGEGRRDSVDSRILNTSLDQMRLNGNSPYTSNHASSASIQATLQNQRDPRHGQAERLSASRFPSSYSASSQHMDQSGRHGRMAPAITGPSAPQFAHGATPVQGQAWAGPFAEYEPRGDLAESSRQTSYLDSRRNSVAESYISNASQLTTESALPRGQRRLEDGYADNYTPRRELSDADLATTHHHQLKHKQIDDLMEQEGGSPGGSQPYSRTPELRVSHKLAERKRRDEMKQLYDTLRDLMPQERGNKASKWEILSKAISEHKAQASMIHRLQHDNQRLVDEINESRREMQALREEMRAMRVPPSGASAPLHHAHQAMPSNPAYHHPEHDRGLGARPDHYRDQAQLPSIRSMEPPSGHAQEAMSGVQYSTYGPSAGPSPSTYRPESTFGRV